MDINRRDFIKKTSVVASASLLTSPFTSLASYADVSKPLDISIFSKHLQFLDYKNTGRMASSMGFSGVDLTVRPKGHVLPDLVKTDLPKAIKDIEAGGSKCQMITTRVESVNNPLDLDVIRAAASNGVKYYRSNWFKYSKEESMRGKLDQYQDQIALLSQLNKEVGIIGCYQNHAGKNVGSSFWEIEHILKTADQDYFGVQHDIRHAMVEGGNSWVNGLRLLQGNIKTIVLKDFKWSQINGQWKTLNVPVGEGMVDFTSYFKRLKKHKLRPPVSLHLEYDLGGAEKGKKEITVDDQVVFDAMKKDLTAINKLWKEA